MIFALKDLGGLNFFLGIEVKKTHNGILLSQEKYATYVLKWVGMMNCKQIRTPMTTSEKLPIHNGIVLSSDDASRC
jgi:hypothetical protein